MKKLLRKVKDSEPENDMKGSHARAEFTKGIRGRNAGLSGGCVRLIGFLFFLLALYGIGQAFGWW